MVSHEDVGGQQQAAHGGGEMWGGVSCGGSGDRDSGGLGAAHEDVLGQ